MTIVANRFTSKALVVLLGLVFCLAFVGRSGAQDDASLKTALQFDEGALDVSEGQSSEYYSRKIDEIDKILATVVKEFDAPELEADAMDRLRKTVLKTIASMKAAIRGIAISCDPDKKFLPYDSISMRGGSSRESIREDRFVVKGVETLGKALERLDEQTELFALERDLDQWREETKNRDIKKTLGRLQLDFETNRAVAERSEPIDVLRRLINEEYAKSDLNEDRINYLKGRLNSEEDRRIKQKIQDFPWRGEQYLQEAIEREKNADSPNLSRILSWRIELERIENRRLLQNRDVDGAVERWRNSLEQCLREPNNDNKSTVVRYLRLVKELDPERANDAINETFERYLASGNLELISNNRLSDLREVVGSNVVMEGRLLDGTPIDWNDYLGKPGVVVFFGTVHLARDKGFPKVYEVLKKYANGKGANIIGYLADENLDAWKPYAKETPWATVSRKLTLEASDKKYRDIVFDYNIGVGKSGKISDVVGLPKIVLYDENGVVVQTLSADPVKVEEFLYLKSPEVVRPEDRQLFELLDVPDGKDSRYYLDRRDAITKTFNDYLDRSSDADAKLAFANRRKIMEQMKKEALQKIKRALAYASADDRSITPEQKLEFIDKYFEGFAPGINQRDMVEERLNFERTRPGSDPDVAAYVQYRLLQCDLLYGRLDAREKVEATRRVLDGKYASERPDADWVLQLKLEALNLEKKLAVEENDESALQNVMDRYVKFFDKNIEEPYVQTKVFGTEPHIWVKILLDELKERDKRPLASDYLRQRLIRKFESRDTESAREFAKDLASDNRRNDLPGGKFDINGFRFDPDAPKNFKSFDWESYRGKPVLIFYYNLIENPNGYEGLDEIVEAYRKYHDVGLEVLGYYAGTPGLEESKLVGYYITGKIVWPTICDKLSLDFRSGKELNYEQYRRSEGSKPRENCPRCYYEFSVPTTILVGADGKVIDVDAFGERLQNDLKELFPNVE